MGKTMTAIFDGTVLRPKSPVDLEPGTRYLVTVEALRAKDDEADAWDLLESLTGMIKYRMIGRRSTIITSRRHLSATETGFRGLLHGA